MAAYVRSHVPKPKHGRPQALYTDGPALFGYQSSTDGRDPRSEFQRALTALGISHLVAPSPEAKRKIERRLGTFQNRLLALLAFEKITRYDAAQVVLDHEVERQNRTICRTTSLSPDDAWNKAREEDRDVMRPAPESSLLDLHLALHLGRRRNADHQIDFLGRSWEIAPTHRHTVTVIHHPGRQFWVVSSPPKHPENRWSDVLARYWLQPVSFCSPNKSPFELPPTHNPNTVVNGDATMNDALQLQNQARRA